MPDPHFRFVRKDRRIYDFSTCRLCGSAHGVVPPEVEHRRTTCRLCGSTQCIGNGLGNGTCPICYHGLLEGWATGAQTCTYKGCTKPAVARGNGRKKFVCKDHLEHIHPGAVEAAYLNRSKNWVLIEESPNSPYPAHV